MQVGVVVKCMHTLQCNTVYVIHTFLVCRYWEVCAVVEELCLSSLHQLNVSQYYTQLVL